MTIEEPHGLMTDTVGGFVTALTSKHGTLAAIIDGKGLATFAEIDARSLRIAQGLLAAGLTKGGRVGILMQNSQDYLATVFGVLRIGGVAVLISTLARPPELAHMLRNAEVDMLMASASYLRNDYVANLEDALPSLRNALAAGRLVLPEAPFLRSIWIWGDARPCWSPGGAVELLARAEAAGVGQNMALAAQAEVTPSDPAVIIYTSGSGAEPKAVVHRQGSFVRQGRALSELMACDAGDRLLSTLPFFWVGGLCTVLTAALSAGAAVICPDDPTPAMTVAFARRWHATHIMQWPQQLELLKDNADFQSALAQMRPAYATQLNLFGRTPPELTPNSLGMTETLGPHSMYPVAPLPAERAGSFGLAVGGIERRIIDPLTGAVQPPGQPGLLCLRGGALMMGMHRKEPRETFDDDGFFRTDDICSITEDGHLYFIGRANDIVKVSGANVSPVEVEAVMRTLPGIKAAFVVGITGPHGAEALVGGVILEDQARISEEELRSQLKTQLSGYKIPRHFVFLQEDEVPMTATAKVYRPGLKRVLTRKVSSP